MSELRKLKESMEASDPSQPPPAAPEPAVPEPAAPGPQDAPPPDAPSSPAPPPSPPPPSPPLSPASPSPLPSSPGGNSPGGSQWLRLRKGQKVQPAAEKQPPPAVLSSVVSAAKSQSAGQQPSALALVGLVGATAEGRAMALLTKAVGSGGLAAGGQADKGVLDTAVDCVGSARRLLTGESGKAGGKEKKGRGVEQLLERVIKVVRLFAKGVSSASGFRQALTALVKEVRTALGMSEQPKLPNALEQPMPEALVGVLSAMSFVLPGEHQRSNSGPQHSPLLLLTSRFRFLLHSALREKLPEHEAKLEELKNVVQMLQSADGQPSAWRDMAEQLCTHLLDLVESGAVGAAPAADSGPMAVMAVLSSFMNDVSTVLGVLLQAVRLLRDLTDQVGKALVGMRKVRSCQSPLLPSALLSFHPHLLSPLIPNHLIRCSASCATSCCARGATPAHQRRSRRGSAPLPSATSISTPPPPPTPWAPCSRPSRRCTQTQRWHMYTQWVTIHTSSITHARLFRLILSPALAHAPPIHSSSGLSPPSRAARCARGCASPRSSPASCRASAVS